MNNLHASCDIYVFDNRIMLRSLMHANNFSTKTVDHSFRIYVQTSKNENQTR